MFNPTRDQARLFFIDSWRKHKAKETLSAMEDIAAELVFQHPEYHALLEDPEAVGQDFLPEDGQVNPFLRKHAGERHAALHDVLEALGETIHAAQRSGAMPDGLAYVERVRQLAGR